MRTIFGLIWGVMATGLLAALALAAGLCAAGVARGSADAPRPVAAQEGRVEFLSACRMSIEQALREIEVRSGQWRSGLAVSDERSVHFHEQALALGRRTEAELRRALRAIDAARAELEAAARRRAIESSLERSEADFESSMEELEALERDAEVLRRQLEE